MIGRSWRSVVPAVVVVAVLLGAGMWPTHRSVVSTQERIDAARAERAELETRVSLLTPLADDIDAIETDLAALDRRVPESHDTAAFLVELDGIADGVGIGLVEVEPAGRGNEDGEAPVGWASIGFELRLRGDYLQVIEFVEAVADAQRLAVIEAVSISVADTGGLDVVVGLRVFHLVDQAPIPGAPVQGGE